MANQGYDVVVDVDAEVRLSFAREHERNSLSLVRFNTIWKYEG